MQKDSPCEKKRSRKKAEVKQKTQGKQQEKPCDEPDEDIFEEEEELEEESDEGFLSDKWYTDGNRDDGFEPDVYEIADDEDEAEEDRRREAAENKKRTRAENKTINYVDPILMEKRISEYYESGNMSVELATDIRKICNRLSKSSRFVNYTYRDEMEADAFFSAYKSICNHKYKVNRGFNPFSYITQVAFHAMVQRIKNEHKERDKTDSYREAHFDDLMRDGKEDPGVISDSMDFEYDG